MNFVLWSNMNMPSLFSGLLMCMIVYKLTGFVSILCFRGYAKLSRVKQVEWNNRGFSTIHALIVASASLYLLLFSSLFKEDSHDDPIINRNSDFSNSLLGFSIGYFIADLTMIFWYFPALGGLEYILHHGLSMHSIILALFSGQAQIYILMVLFTESTTPFVNLRWYLDVAGQKSSTLYVFNGVLLFLGWLVARIILFVIFFAHIYINFDQITLAFMVLLWMIFQVKKVFPLGFYSLLTVPPMLAVMNVVWFWKIARGLLKILSKPKRHDQ